MLRLRAVPTVHRALVTGCLGFGIVGAAWAQTTGPVSQPNAVRSGRVGATAAKSMANKDAVTTSDVGVAEQQAEPLPEPRPWIIDPLMLVIGAAGPAAVHAQVLLDRAGFSPGVIDGVFGGLTQSAIAAFQSAHDLKSTGNIDAPTWQALGGDEHTALAEATIGREDARGPFRRVPTNMMAKAKLRTLGYGSLVEALAEKFHTTPAYLAELNPGKRLAAGSKILVPNVVPEEMVAPAVPEPPSLAMNEAAPEADQVLADWEEQRRKARLWTEVLADLNVSAAQPKAAKVVVDRSEKAVKAYDADGRLLAHFPATLGSRHDPLPIGKWRIANIHPLPTYNYNSDLFWDARDGQRAVIAPGPNNPVGVAWLGLTKAHYGIHGTPEPQNISYSYSHGCIRLTNWDVARLAQMVTTETPAILQR